MYRFPLSLLLVFSFSLIGYTQSWDKTFLHESGLAKGFDVIQASDNGYIVVGEVDLPTGAIRHYIWLFKTDIDGNLLWSKIYNEPDVADQKGRAVVEAVNGDIFVVGANNNKAMVLKTDAQGEPLWTKAFGGDGINAFYDVSQDPEGNLILVGELEETLASNQHEIWAMGINAAGDSLWSAKYFEPSFYGSAATVVTPLADNNYLVAGNYNGQVFSQKISGTDGSLIWSNTYQFSVGDQLFAAATNTEETKLIFGGNITGFAGFSPTLFETNDEGESATPVNFIPTSFGAITDIQTTSNNGLLLTGSSYDFWSLTGSNMTGFASKMNSNFEIEWSLTFADSLDKQGAAIIEDTDGNSIIVGSRGGGVWLKKIGVITTTTSLPQAEIQLYPNPAQRLLHISMPEVSLTEELVFTLHNTEGAAVYEQKLTKEEEQLSLPDLRSGIYYYTINSYTTPLKSGKLVIH